MRKDYNKTVYAGSGGQQSKGQNISNPPPSGTGSDISSSMYGNKSHVALNKVNVSVLQIITWLNGIKKYNVIYHFDCHWMLSSRMRNNRFIQELHHLLT